MHAFFYFTTISPRKRARHIEFPFNTQESFVAMGWYWNIGSGKNEKLDGRQINCHFNISFHIHAFIFASSF